MFICERDDCTGCQACRMICPKSAISMQENEKGHIYPSIDANSCIECGLCKRICPSLNPPTYSNGPLKCYAAHIKDANLRNYSSSGGVSYAISKKIIESGGAFCGVVWSENGAFHKMAQDDASLSEFQGSKYAHSDVKDTYKEIKQRLEYSQRVVFSGTPCQCAGLRSYLGKHYHNLILVDIICHGVPSRKFLRDCNSEVEKSHGRKLRYVRFREKNPDQLRTCTSYVFEGGVSDKVKNNKSLFYRLFDDNYTLRENCYNCKYCSVQRVSDITIADFWGYLPRKFKFRDYRKGISIVMINTRFGQDFFDEIKDELSYEERSYIENINANLEIV